MGFPWACPSEQEASDAVEIGSSDPVGREGVGRSFRKFSEWECRTIPTIYAFGPFRLDAQGVTLFLGAEPVALSKRAVALLRILVDRAGALVSKDALIEAAWPSLAVEDSNLTVQIAALRRALGEVPGGEDWIVTLPRRGYRFVGPAVTKSEAQVPAAPMADPASKLSPTTAPALPDKPSIAVLPFENLSGDPEQGYFADGMVEEIITALSRIRWLFVIARNSSFTYRGRAADVKQVGKELGVLYVLEGSVRKAGNRIRITAQLLDATNGAHLWADHFDGLLEDVFELQDNVASSVAGVIEPTLETAEHSRSIQRPTNDLTAYDLYLQARVARESADRQGIMRALELVEHALDRDPNYGSALAVAVGCQGSIYLSNWTNDLEATQKKGIDLARRALRVAGDDPYVLANTAWALGLFGEDIASAIALTDRALQLNPSFAYGWYRSGILRHWAGQYDLAIEHFERSIRLSPRESRSQTYLVIGISHFFARRIEKAAEMLGLSLQEKPTWPAALRFMASCLAHMGRLKEAQQIVKRLRAITSVVIPSAEHWRIREDREYFLDGLRLAAGVGRDQVAGH
jgi:TolB-like protein